MKFQSRFKKFLKGQSGGRIEEKDVVGSKRGEWEAGVDGRQGWVGGWRLRLEAEVGCTLSFLHLELSHTCLSSFFPSVSVLQNSAE